MFVVLFNLRKNNVFRKLNFCAYPNAKLRQVLSQTIHLSSSIPTHIFI